MNICAQSGRLNDKLKKEIHRVSSECLVCAQIGPPLPTRKASLRHVKQEFVNEIQIYYAYFDIDHRKHVVLSIVDTGTAYGEGVIVLSRNMETTPEIIERAWVGCHRQLRRVSGGAEFNSKQFVERFKSREIQFHPVQHVAQIGLGL